jgi:predicted nucleic acid-binding protein
VAAEPALVDTNVLLEATDERHPTLLALLERVPSTGNRIHDANIVATAMVHRVRTIVSLNPDDFGTFRAEVTVVSPGEVPRMPDDPTRRPRSRRRPPS